MSAGSRDTCTGQQCQSSMSDVKNVDSVGRQYWPVCRSVCRGLNRFLSLCNAVVCCMVIGSCSNEHRPTVVFNALLFTEIIQKQVWKRWVLSNAEAQSPEKDDNLGKYSKFPAIPAGNFRMVDSRQFPILNSWRPRSWWGLVVGVCPCSWDIILQYCIVLCVVLLLLHVTLCHPLLLPVRWKLYGAATDCCATNIICATSRSGWGWRTNNTVSKCSQCSVFCNTKR